MQYKSVEGFKFVHIANAFLSQQPLNAKFNGRDISWHVALDLLYPEVAEAEQSCYLVYVDNEEAPVYVGQYSGVFKDRWLKKGKYVWHGKHDDTIKSLLEDKKSLSIWLSVEPYASLADGRKININKEIEQIIIESIKPQWNTTGKHNDASKGFKVSDICEKYAKKMPDYSQSVWAKFDDKELSIYVEKLTSINAENWASQQQQKIRDLSRCQHFLNYIEAGITAPQALEWVWKEFP